MCDAIINSSTVSCPVFKSLWEPGRSQFHFMFFTLSPQDFKIMASTNIECGYPEIKCDRND